MDLQQNFLATKRVHHSAPIVGSVALLYGNNSGFYSTSKLVPYTKIKITSCVQFVLNTWG